MRQGIDEAVRRRRLPRAGDEVEHDLGVRRRLADRALRDELAAERQAVGEVAVVADRDAADFELGKERLHVAEDRLAGRRVAHVAHRHVAGDAGEGRGLGEMVADEAKLAFRVELAAIEADDARRLLAAMLERVEAERRERRGVGVAQNAEHPALFAQGVAV